MNDFSELENELKGLRPARPSAELFSRVERGIAEPEKKIPDKILRPDRFQINWAWGLGLAAAAVLLLLARIGYRPAANRVDKVATISPAPTFQAATPAAVRDEFIANGATQVVYNVRDEGLHFRANAEQPVRRVRSRTRDTWQWQNPVTGASLRVSYPSEQVELIPVSGQ
jgi:hypothetical protein